KITTRMKKNAEKILPFIKTIHKKDVDDYMERKSKKLNVLFRGKTLQEKQLHELRKRLKEIYYNRKSLDLPSQNKSLAKTNGLQEVLGNWHDCRVTIGHLKKAIDSGTMNAAEKKNLRKVRSKISSDSEKLFKKVN